MLKTNKIYKMDCCDGISQICDNSVHLVVTSPPYNIAKDYGDYKDDLNFDEYIEWLTTVFKDVYRVVVEGGRVCINVGYVYTSKKANVHCSDDVSIRQMLPTYAHLIVNLRQIGYTFQEHTIWDKVGNSEDNKVVFGCLTGDTIIRTNDGWKKIKDINIGDKVWSMSSQPKWNSYHKFRPKSVIKTFNSGFRDVYELKTRRRTINATDNHEFFSITERKHEGTKYARKDYDLGWHDLGSLRDGDYLVIPKRIISDKHSLKTIKYYDLPNSKVNIDFSKFVLEKILSKSFIGKRETYDISVEKNHNFLANGCIVHNSYPFPVDVYSRSGLEHILVFKKGKKRIDIQEHRKNVDNKINKSEYFRYVDTIWRFSGERQNIHCAPFPLKLPKRLIKMYSFIGDTVLDPFIGSGTTAIACKELNRKYIGFELNPEYLKIAKHRIDNRAVLWNWI